MNGGCINVCIELLNDALWTDTLQDPYNLQKACLFRFSPVCFLTRQPATSTSWMIIW